jgi:hypothetical protein
VKTTIELPDELFREAKATAARRGMSLKDLFREALEAALPQAGTQSSAVKHASRLDVSGTLTRRIEEAARSSGKTTGEFIRSALLEKLGPEAGTTDGEALEWPYPPLRGVPAEELRRIDEFIEEAFEQIEPEGWE